MASKHGSAHHSHSKTASTHIFQSSAINSNIKRLDTSSQGFPGLMAKCHREPNEDLTSEKIGGIGVILKGINKVSPNTH